MAEPAHEPLLWWSVPRAYQIKPNKTGSVAAKPVWPLLRGRARPNAAYDLIPTAFDFFRNSVDSTLLEKKNQWCASERLIDDRNEYHQIKYYERVLFDIEICTYWNYEHDKVKLNCISFSNLFLDVLRKYKFKFLSITREIKAPVST